ncbi:nucleoside-diphosphate sugar epimerase/dehydratase [Salinivibrio proteolyticus]|uniref:Nucleoside-diphosphate sugar epimerase/dehydratase n=1 Tax=Salinivibrio proteolyticus TaxID=334715 RepID=A0ABY7LFX9_9GAMM|nr:nucleoside-diphosphate sugar epimerase/dehydratase [Salinivibrio proteolyticus]WBA16131.1 nucleoside-diphosphate sugar epimerase/dehydratase [Salinivibrio proteolyticus]
MGNLKFIWSLPRVYKRLISIFIDTLLIIGCLFGALVVRLGELPVALPNNMVLVAIGTVGVTIVAFYHLGLYRAVLRYLTFHALLVVAIGAFISAVTVATLSFYSQAAIPRTVPFIYFTFLVLVCGSARLAVRQLIVQTQKDRQFDKVVIYGAGETGRQLANALRSSSQYQVKAFVDNNPALARTVVQGISVYPATSVESVVTRFNADKILLAMPRATRTERKEIIDSLIHLPVKVLTVPDFDDIVEGKASVDQLKDVAIDDLLGREQVAPEPTLMGANTSGKVVMVTGAGGSIGSELCRQILAQSPKTLVLLELSEYCLYQIDKELNQLTKQLNVATQIVPLLGSVQRPNRLTTIMKAFDVQTVYHAAAYKHVPLVEYNVIEGVRNNVFGTYHCAKAAIAANVESFVLISTDKAVRPTNVMGATKRMAELALQALARESGHSHQTRFTMVRFGNVLGSSGSVIPLFKRQIAEGAAVTVTHPDIIRYFMTIPEAAQLVIQAGAMGKGGDVFVLDMGEPVKIVDLAKNLIRLSGLEVKSADNPNGDIEIKFTGLRPGEKLYEELLIGDNVAGTGHERIMTANEVSLSLVDFESIITQLDSACQAFDYPRIQKMLQDAPTQFCKDHTLGDLVWKASEASVNPNEKNVVKFDAKTNF